MESIHTCVMKPEPASSCHHPHRELGGAASAGHGAPSHLWWHLYVTPLGGFATSLTAWPWDGGDPMDMTRAMSHKSHVAVPSSIHMGYYVGKC